VKKFNKKFNEMLKEMNGAVANISADVGMSNPSATGNIGQSGPGVYGPPDDARNLFGTQVDKPKKSKFKAPKKSPGFKTPFKIIRRTPPSL